MLKSSLCDYSIVCRKEFYFSHVTKVSAKHFARWLMQTVLLGEKHQIFFWICSIKMNHIIMNNIRREVISYRYILIYFIRFLWLYKFLAAYFKSSFFWIDMTFPISNSDWQIAFIWSCVNSFMKNLADLPLVQIYMSFNIISLLIFFRTVT